jgi:hypothetical protein
VANFWQIGGERAGRIAEITGTTARTERSFLTTFWQMLRKRAQLPKGAITKSPDFQAKIQVFFDGNLAESW